MNYIPILRRMRQRIFDYPPHAEAKADRVLGAVKKRAMRQQAGVKAATGPFSGLTRAELAASKTCEPDWF